MTAACKTALALTQKALKAFSFYPAGHPHRERIVQGAFHALSQAASEDLVSVIVHRNGFAPSSKPAALDQSPMTKSLAQDLFAREIQRLVVLSELSLAEYVRFLSLLALDPPKLLAAGGLTALLKQHGIETIILNEIDITAVFTRKKAEEDDPEAGEEDASDPEQPAPAATTAQLDQLSQMSIAELITMMALEKDDHQYRQLARLLLAKGLPLKSERNFGRLSILLVAMVRQSTEKSRSTASREQAQMVLQQLGLGEMAEHLLDHLEDPDFKQKETVYVIFRTLGIEVVDAVIRRLIAVGLKNSRKALTTALLRIGPPAEPALLELLKDGRWQVVLAAVAILAESGSRDAVKGLIATAHHSDGRVRMESIRALAGIGGIEATTALIELLHDPNQAIGVHAATWIGNTKNQRALPSLLQLVMTRDLRGRYRTLKKEALLAIGRIGDRRALDPLSRLVQRSHWIFPQRWNELKLSAVEAIGHLGGESAQQFLRRVSAQGGELGQVSAAALAAMAQKESHHHD
jgi:HEAT repeat protein